MGAKKKRSGRQRAQLLALVVAALAAWGIAAYFRMAPKAGKPGAQVGPEQPADPSRGANPTSTGDPSAASGQPAGSAPVAAGGGRPATAMTSGSPTVDATGEPAATGAAPTASATVATGAPVEDLNACVEALFAPDTFDAVAPDFTFLCQDPYPRRGITRVQAQVLRGRGDRDTVTEGMREWAGLGWYQLAAYAVFRGHCCRPAPKLIWTFNLACPLDQAMVKLEQAVTARDQAALDAAMAAYTAQARCITRFGQASNFGQATMPGPGMNQLKKYLARVSSGG